MKQVFDVCINLICLGNPLVFQLYHNAINTVSFLNWKKEEITDNEEKYIVAIWKVKRLKAKPVLENSTPLFSLN